MFGSLLAIALVFTPGDAARAYTNTQEFVSSCTPRDSGTGGAGVAAHWILDRASALGADVRRDIFTAPTPNGPKRFINLYGEFASDATSRWVVVVSHYDSKPGVRSPFANDGGSTTGLLIALADVLANCREPKGNVLLVWTDGEECSGDFYAPNDGFQGSRRAVGYLKEKGRAVQAVLCLDMLGDRDLHITIPSNGSPTLAKIAQHAARRIGEPGLVTLIDEQVKDDHVPFLEANMQAIDLIDFSYGPKNAWWHTADDTMDKLSEASFLKSGRLVCEMLNILL